VEPNLKTASLFLKAKSGGVLFNGLAMCPRNTPEATQHQGAAQRFQAAFANEWSIVHEVRLL
jgi:hypothetical protein